MHFWDWLFGECEIGWAKTAFLSLAFAVPIILLLFSPEDFEGGGSRFLVIALGYPLLALTRRLYWNWRDGQLADMLSAGDSRLAGELESVKRWQPRIWFRYASATEND